MINSALYVKIDGGKVDTQLGDDFTQTLINGDGPNVENSIEVFAASISCTVGREGSGGHGGMARAARQWSDLRVKARIGKSTTHLAKAARLNSRIEAELHIFRQNHDTGVTELLHTLKITQGRIAYFAIELPNTMDHATASEPAYMVLGISGHTIQNTSGLGPDDTDAWGGTGA